MRACDFHIHTEHSFDSRSPAAAVLERAVAAGLHVIAITDHNTVAGALAAEKIAKAKRLPILVIPGQEVRTSGGELLVLGIRSAIPPGRGLRETAMDAKKQGGFLIAPHPFDWLRDGMGKRFAEVADLLDAVETLNRKARLEGMNGKAAEAAKQAGLPAVASSDAHIVSEIGACRTIVQVSGKTQNAVFRAIREGKTELIGKRAGWGTWVLSSLQKLK